MSGFAVIERPEHRPEKRHVHHLLLTRWIFSFLPRTEFAPSSALYRMIEGTGGGACQVPSLKAEHAVLQCKSTT